jgi:Spy/CpxP family protein refolding chaperone
MKKTIATLLLSSAFGTALIFAQSDPKGPRTPPDPATIAQRRVDMLTRRLSLTAAQQADALKIFTTSVTAEVAVQADLRAARTDLRAAVKSNSTGAITNAANQIGNLTAQLTTSEATADAAFYQILTADQQSKYGDRPGPGFGGGPRGFRGPRQ